MKTLTPAVLKDRSLVGDVLAFPSEEAALRCWWLGQSGFLLSWMGRHFLLDPYLSDSLTSKYARTDKPHVRCSERVVDPHLLDFIDLVTASHLHTDHLDGDTLRPLLACNPALTLLIPEAIRAEAVRRLGCATDLPTGMEAGQTLVWPAWGLSVTAVPAAHELLDRDAFGRNLYLGFVLRFGPFSVYHSGDTVWFEGMEDLLRPFDVDIAFLPINGRHPERRVAGNLSPEEAVRLADAIGAKTVVPCHYDMFRFNTANPQVFVDAARSAGQPFRVFRNGEGATYHAKLGFLS
ncbi:MAG: hypothetical protein RLY31_2118 [Bacteroidota bacterium]|jgi:L-ascorbate metabolism protein UlaG (beta-lactamase superfamily)